MKAKDNPFATCFLHQIPYIPVQIPWEDITGRIESLQYRAAILGPEGSGKTALLLQLQSLLARRKIESVYVQVYRCLNYLWPFHTESIRRIDPEKVYLIDGFDLLPPACRLYLRLKMRRAKGFIVSSHKTSSLPVLIHCQTNMRLLNEILMHLLPNPTASHFNLGEKLFKNRNGNIRDVLRDLYEFYSEMDCHPDRLPAA